jgi:hypothetical protein
MREMALLFGFVPTASMVWSQLEVLVLSLPLANCQVAMANIQGIPNRGFMAIGGLRSPKVECLKALRGASS